MRLALTPILYLFCALPMLGCGQKTEPPPTTQKVEGKIVLANGKAYTAGGTVTFYHDSVQGVTCTGDIKPDGTFTLLTITAQHAVPGAQEGSYSVTIMPTSQDQSARSIELRKKYVIASGENDLTVVVD